LVIKQELENRVIPLKILLEALETTYGLITNILPPDEVPELEIGVKYIKKIVAEMIEGANEGLPIVGHHFAFQAEYLSCFDIVPVCIEGISYILSCIFPHGVERFNDIISDGFGHPYHTCSSQKSCMGMTLDDLFRFDAIITPTAPCDNTYASYPFFKYKENIPLILPDLPFLHQEKSLHYYGDQIKIALNDLGKVIGQEPDFETMKKHIEIENKVNRHALEIFELKKARPNPVSNLFNAFAAAASIYLAGRNEHLKFYEENLEIAKRRYKRRGRHGEDESEEKMRSIWPYMLIFFSLETLEWLDRSVGMSVLFDIFNYNFSPHIDVKNEEKMWYDMANKGMSFPMMKQSTDFYYPFIEDCVRLAKEYNADNFVFTAHIGCKQFGSVPQILKEALREELGIPMLIIDLDVGDERLTNINIIRDKINIFTQTLM